jgi:branched-chain amino acid transport system permease protein
VEYLFSVLIFAVIWAILVLSLNVLLGYGGQVSLGHAVFFGLGAYTSAIALTRFELPFLAAIVVSSLVTAIIGGLLGLPSLRVRHDFLVLVTIGMNFIFVGTVSYTKFAGGTLGIVGIPRPSLFGATLNNWQYLLFCLTWLLLVMAFSARLPLTWGGLGLLSLRDDEDAASAVGVSPARYKITAFVISGAIAGIGGSLYAPFVGNVSPGRFGFLESVTLLSMLIFGGVGTVRGAVFGGMVLKVLPEVLRGFSELRFALYGLILLLGILFMPQGVLGRDSPIGHWIDGLRPKRAKSVPRTQLTPTPSEGAGAPVGARTPSRTRTQGTATVVDEHQTVELHVLEARDVTVDFGGLRAVDHVNMSVRSGEILGLLGPNGAGKTTLFNAIVGSVKLTSGKVLLDGEEIQRLPPSTTVRKGVARTFQIVKPFVSMSVQGNITTGLGAHTYPKVQAFAKPYRNSASAAAEVAKALHLPHAADERTDTLPVGLLRKLEVGRALATDAPILLLDEPAAGLSHDEVEELAEAIRGIARSGRAIILVEHNMHFAMNVCDRIVLLASGQIIAEGTPTEVATDPDVIRAYLGEESA